MPGAMNNRQNEIPFYIRRQGRCHRASMKGFTALSLIDDTSPRANNFECDSDYGNICTSAMLKFKSRPTS